MFGCVLFPGGNSLVFIIVFVSFLFTGVVTGTDLRLGVSADTFVLFFVTKVGDCPRTAGSLSSDDLSLVWLGEFFCSFCTNVPELPMSDKSGGIRGSRLILECLFSNSVILPIILFC